jgi:hypothetical protein
MPQVPVPQRRVYIQDTEGNNLLLNSDGSFGTPSSSTISDGSKAVTSAGTAVALGSATTREIYVTALDTNTGKIFIGGSTVSSTSGMYIYPGQTMTFSINNLSKIYIDAENNGEGVQFTYVA